VENASANAVELVVEMLELDGEVVVIGAAPQAIDIPVVTVSPTGVDFSTLDPIGAAAAAAAGQIGDSDTENLNLAASATVRIPAFTISEGLLVCGPQARVTTVVDSDRTPIPLSGAGTGTVGFDSGSVGESGQRLLLNDVHYSCGESVVIRIGNADTAAGGDLTGQLAVVPGGEPSPFDSIEVPNSDSESAPTTVAVQVSNLGSVIGTVRLAITNATGDQQDFDVTVPPDTLTTGEFVCGTEFRVSASYPDPETPDDNSTERLVILTGDGTGSPGFDENSVSREGERILSVGTHLECGNTILVTIRDDVAPVGFQGLGVFFGTVEVLGAGEP
jgi:hypothetical protein